MIDRLTCILCPIGCELDVEAEGGEFRVRGNQCERGLDFASEEILRPRRNLATSVPLAGTTDRMLSVRLSESVPRESLIPILAEIARLRPSPPVRRGDVLIVNVCGSGADVIATRTLDGIGP
jgi:CxxC motif-containing protein